LILRNDDLDSTRFRLDYVQTMLEDLRWLGLDWSEGPDIGGPYAPYNQSERQKSYLAVFKKLYDGGFIFPCTHSRRDVIEAAGAPHEQGGVDGEPIYPVQFRPAPGTPLPPWDENTKVNWRFRVPEGEELSFHDQRLGLRRAEAGRDFGDFLVWRKDSVPSYQLACVADDAAMAITEVVRGEDLVVSTFRQLLLYRALGFTPPAFYHCPLMLDEHGMRLAKRHDALSLRTLRERGQSVHELTRSFASEKI
jgi:glutamyl-tRNA synthetase